MMPPAPRCPVRAILLAAALAVSAGAEDLPLSPPPGGGTGAWRFHDGREFPGAAGALAADADGTLRLQYDFAKGGNYVAAIRDLDRPMPAGALAFEVDKPADATLAVRYTDSSGQTFQKPLAWDHAGWQAVVVEPDGWAGWWGGPADGILHPPIRAVSLLVTGEGIEPPAGEVRFRSVVLRPGPPTAVAPAVVRTTYTVADFRFDEGFHPVGPGSLERSLWSVDFGQGDEASLHHSISLLGTPQVLEIRVGGVPEGAVLSVRLGSHFQTFERDAGQLDGSIQTFTLPVPPEGWKHWGGENDGVVRPPLRITALVLRRGDAAARPTNVFLYSLRCRTRLPSSAAVTLLPRLREVTVSPRGRTLEATWDAWNLLETDMGAAVTITVRDWDGRILQTVRRDDPPIPAGGARTTQAVRFDIPADKCFAEAEFALKARGLRVPPARAAFARAPDDAGDAAPRPESPWGMGLYLYRYPDTDEGFAQMDRAAALAQAAGVKWSREEFSWGRLEPKPGELDFHYYDRVVETAARHGITLYGLLCYWSRWTKPYTEQGIDDYCRWARAVVRRYKDRIRHWEIWNEPNIFFWSGPKELYPVLLKRAHDAVKAEDPDAQVLGISTAAVDRAFIRRVLDAGSPFDALTIHPYRARLREEAFIRELKEVSALVGGRKVWITEMGWPTHAGGPTDERAQARLLARCYLAAAASGVCPSVSWYDFRCDGDDPFYHEHNFGVVRPDLTPKPAYRALATVCRTLARGAPRPRTDFDGGVLAVATDDALAIWSPDRAVVVPVRVTSGAPKVINLMGEPVDAASKDGVLKLSLAAGAPVFVTGGAVAPAGPVEAAEADARPETLRF